ncbi:lanthionine biosynthesis protein [Oceanobacillus piezotolerans]|uniref:Lanthionine biosynthesis protein n=1 Tax=Oceanobacillus piezotolerans TaxID=2448030 RepID=A0A498D660_9BACI|nr:lanthionine biosynthesis protein [Oceanobacillus piezotolerans]RLL42880.1 lanthionine biosynthesis protein [Oceanobacillus piezotolerans]
MELLTEITKNPFVLYRGSDIGKEWYRSLQSNSIELSAILEKIHVLEKEIEEKKHHIIFLLEQRFQSDRNKVLLNIKRDAFNLRINRLRKYNEETLPEINIIDLNGLIELLEEKTKLEGEFQEKYDEVLDSNRKTIQSEINNEVLLKTIIFFNDKIYKKVEKYMSIKVKEHNKKLKKLDFFLVKLMMRASMKTSPFSYLTKVGSATPSFKVNNTENVEVNHAMVMHIFYRFLRTNKKALENVPVIVSNFGRRDTKIYYVSQHSTKNSKKVFETSDKFVEFGLDQVVIDFLETYKHQELTFRMFKGFLQSKDLYRGHELNLYQKLVELKVLIQKVDIGSGRSILTNMISFLNRYSLDSKFVEALQLLRLSLEQFQKGNVEQRRAAWSQMKDVSRQWAQADMDFGNEVLFEDIVSPVEVKDEISPYISEEFINCLTDFILLFDVNIRVQYELAAMFQKQFGKENVRLSNSKMLNEVFFSNIQHFYPYYQNSSYRYEGATAEEVHVLDDLRDQFIYELKQLLAQQPDAEEIDIKPLIKKYVKRIPSDYKVNSETSVTLFAQTTGEKIVLNDVYDGQEKFLSRFKDYFARTENDKEYPAYVDKNYMRKNYYEVEELFGFNGGIHDRKQQQRLNLNIGYQQFQDRDLPSIEDFFVQYDENSRKLKLLDANYKDARIAYKSSLVPIFLPGVLSVMLLLFQSGRLNFDVNRIGKVRDKLPRLTFDYVVMYRRRWNLDANVQKQWLDELNNDAKRYQQVLRYFQKMDLPKQFFLKFYKRDDSFSREKPIFIDLDVPILFRLFIHECKQAIEQDTKMYVEEAIPGANDTLREYMVEYTVDKIPNVVPVYV